MSCMYQMLQVAWCRILVLVALALGAFQTWRGNRSPQQLQVEARAGFQVVIQVVALS